LRPDPPTCARATRWRVSSRASPAPSRPRPASPASSPSRCARRAPPSRGALLRTARPALPRQRVPERHTPMSYLRELVWSAVPARYPNLSQEDRARIAHELDVIERKDFPGYFLIVREIVEEAKRRGILCQGRGSAANSAVCYLLGI